MKKEKRLNSWHLPAPTMPRVKGLHQFRSSESARIIRNRNHNHKYVFMCSHHSRASWHAIQFARVEFRCASALGDAMEKEGWGR